MKITQADKWFSRCVRERAEWKCEKCGKQYDSTSMGLHCSHFVGRGNYAVRFEPLNADAHCYYCHSQFEQNPHKHTEWKREQLGYSYDVLIEKSNNLMLGKLARKSASELSKHYKAEYDRMMELRAQGVTGRIEFAGYL